MAQTHAHELPEGFLTQTEVQVADQRIANGEFANRDEALAVMATERDAKSSLAQREKEGAAASFPPAGAAPSIGEVASFGDPPADTQSAPPPEAVEPVAVEEPEVEEAAEPEAETKRGRK